MTAEHARPRAAAPEPERGEVLPGVRNTHRGRLGQGRRRQEHDRDEPRARARRERRAVGVLDADVYGPSLPLLLGVHEPPAHRGARRRK